jgi:Protein of unknown function (DUF2971)
MRLYHFTNRQYGLENIERRRLKIARIGQLNDPFEFLGVASRSPDVRRRYKELKSGWDKIMGVLCFSGGWKNPVQWSHYADHHRGVCLGFDIEAQVHRVNYVEQRLNPNMRALKKVGPAAEKHVMQILTTKFLHWSYEDEYRVFPGLDEKDQCGLYFFPFANGLALKQVIVGHDCTVTHADLSKALGELGPTVECFKARLAFQTFEVARQHNASFWK